MVGVHGDGAGTRLEVFRRGDGLGDLFRIVAARPPQSVYQELAGVIAEGRKDVGGTVVLLPESFQEGLYLLVLFRVMGAEIRMVEGVFSGNVCDLRIVPAVGAQDGAGNAQLASLLDDLAHFFIVAGDEHDICVGGLELRQGRLEVLILLQEGFLH